MAQVDKVSYLPLLFWFVVLFFFVYGSVAIYYIPRTFGAIKARRLYLRKLLRRFWKYQRQFKLNLKMLGMVSPSNISQFSRSYLFCLRQVKSPR